MSPARARGTRRPQLERDLATGARCANPSIDEPQPTDWHRDENESTASWAIRRLELLSYCQGCPVIAQCREVALRYDDRGTEDDTVRGGMTAAQLGVVRRGPRHRGSLNRAVQADTEPAERHAATDAQRRQVGEAAQELRQVLLVHHDSRTASRHTTRVREATDELAARRAARRVANGWMSAAA